MLLRHAPAYGAGFDFDVDLNLGLVLNLDRTFDFSLFLILILVLVLQSAQLDVDQICRAEFAHVRRHFRTQKSYSILIPEP